MARADFSQITKDVIAKRAAYRCSFPGCNATLIGPGYESGTIDNIGECAHIYAASGRGPRCQHNLTDADLVKPENGIFLCRKHHSLIDKSQGKKYPSETLMLYKQMHEHKIAEELGHISYPLLWLSQIEIIESPVLKAGVVYSFTKTTILFGGNGTGKTFLMDYIYTLLTGQTTLRTKKGRIVIKGTMSSPVWHDVICEIEEGKLNYKINGQSISFCPFSIEVVYLQGDGYKNRGDMVKWIGEQIGKDREFVKRMIEDADLSKGYTSDKACLVLKRTRPYEEVIIKLRKKGSKTEECNWNLCQFSGTEQASLVFDLVLGYMRKLSRYKNTLFLIDWSCFNWFDGSKTNYYFHLFYENSSYFQTISTKHTMWENVDWAGWNIIKMTEETNLLTRRTY